MPPILARLDQQLGPGVTGLIGFLIFVVVVFSLSTPQFLTGANFDSIAFLMH